MRKAIALFFSVLLLGGCNQKVRFVGVWRSGSHSNIITNFKTWDEFVADGNTKAHEQNLRLIDFEYYQVNGTNHYVGVWRNGSYSNIITNFNTWDDFISDGNIKTHEQNLRLIDFEHYQVNGTNHYVGVWRNGSYSNTITNFNTWDEFIADGHTKTHEQDLRLIDFEHYQINGTNHYVGVWQSGSYSNIITNFKAWDDFIADGNTKAHEQKLRLVDFEHYQVNGINHYVGVWRSGSYSNIITSFKTWDDFIADGNTMAHEQNLRLIDFEPIIINDKVQSKLPPRGGSTPTSPPSCEGLPEIPNYVEIENSSVLEVDFDNTVEGHPKIIIPSDLLDFLPTCDGEIIFPDNFCGIRIKGAIRFQWVNNSGEILGDNVHNYHPVYNSIPVDETLENIDRRDRTTYYFDGIEFTGPIGACDSNSGIDGGWNFPSPLTKTGTISPSDSRVKLQIEITLGYTEIEFLNYNFHPEGLNHHELFREETYDELANMAMFPEFYDIRGYIQNACIGNPTGCPIGDSEKWW